MAFVPINFADKLSLFDDQWSPKVIAEMNDYQFKLVKVQGEFVWHDHEDTDEVFVVLAGELTIEFRDATVRLGAGEMLVVPQGGGTQAAGRRGVSIARCGAQRGSQYRRGRR